MKLSEIYQKGAEILETKKLGFLLRGVETEFVLKNNEEIFKKYKFLQRAINSIEPTTGTRLLNIDLEVPIIMSAISGPIPEIQQDGLLKVAQALKEVGSMVWTGTPLPTNLKNLVQIGVPWVQTIKPYTNRTKIMELILEAQDAGVTAIGIEVDAGQGTKILDTPMAGGCSPISVAELRDIKKNLSCPLVLKGILSSWDAEKALEVGADAIVVSNHGAHTIDYLPHPLEVMDEIVRITGGRIPIIVDGGFRRGTDVLKALAFGAQAVAIGRPILYGLAAGGEKGVKTVIEEMTGELIRAMAMTGVANPGSAHKDILLFEK